MSISEQQLWDLVDEHLVPLFPGSEIDWIAARPGQATAAISPGGQILYLRGDPAWSRRIKLQRTQPFTTADQRLARQFVQTARLIASSLGTPAERPAVRSLVEDVISRDVGDHRHAVLRAMLETAADWSLRTYEGRDIAVGFGLLQHAPGPIMERHLRQHSAVSDFTAFASQPFAPVLSNGIETLMVFDDRGGAPSLEVTPRRDGDAPRRFARVANWARDGRLAVCLARGREVLVFGDGSLLYARRNGHWVSFDRDAAIKRWINKDTTIRTELRHAVYDTCLDASFARTGACIGIVEASSRLQVTRIVGGDDLLATSATSKATLLRAMIANRSFPAITREIRLELSRLDGALIIDRDGQILAAGAILRVPGGSSTGGRKLAAQTMAAKVGLGVKVSADGGVEVFAGPNSKSKYQGFAPFQRGA